MFGAGPGGRITLGSHLTSLRSGHEPAAAGPAPPLLRALPARHQPLGADRGQLPGEPPSGRDVPAAPWRTPADATRADLEDFLADLLARRSAATAATRYKVLRVLYRWLEEEEDVPNPMAKMRPPILPEQPVPVIPPDGLRRLLKACDGKGFEARRDTALIMLLLDTGARRDELMSRMLADLDQDLDVLLVLGKGRRERALPDQQPLSESQARARGPRLAGPAAHRRPRAARHPAPLRPRARPQPGARPAHHRRAAPPGPAAGRCHRPAPGRPHHLLGLLLRSVGNTASARGTNRS